MSAASSGDEARRWLAYARDDLAAAEHAAAIRDLAPRIGCYHAQQAAEKSLKAALIFLQVRFPFIHGLDELRDLLPPGWSVQQRHPDLSALTLWAVEARYPDVGPDPMIADAADAAPEAREIWEAVLDDLDQHGLDVKEFR